MVSFERLVEHFFSQAMDVVGKNLVAKLNSEMHGRLALPPGVESLRSQAMLGRIELQTEQIRQRMALENRKAVEAQAKDELQVMQGQARMMLAERRSRLYDLEIAKAELAVKQQRLRLESGQRLALPAGVDEPIRGALDFRADAGGISGEARSDYLAWLESLAMGKVLLILGKRGSGKTAFACKLGEYVFAAHQVPV